MWKEKELKVIHTRSREGAPLVIVRNLPGCDVEMSPDQMRAMASALNAAADDCENRKITNRQISHYELSYTLSRSG